MEYLEKLFIPLITITASLLGSIYVTFRALTKKHSEEWLNNLREALSSFLAIGAYIPLESTREELYDYKKRLFLVQMLLNTTEDEEHGKLAVLISNLQNYLMNNFNAKTIHGEKYSDMMAAVMIQYFVVATKEKRKTNKNIFNFLKQKKKKV